METVDERVHRRVGAFMEKAKAEKKPFFVWLNTTRMHVFTRVPQDYLKRCRTLSSAHDVHCAGMLQHDEEIGGLLGSSRTSGWTRTPSSCTPPTTDPNTRPGRMAATTPYRSEKMTTWEGGVRVPLILRWPGQVKPGTELNGIQSHEDLFTTLAAAGGVPDIKARLAQGDALGTAVPKKSFIDGVDNTRYWTGAAAESARSTFFYYEESALRAIRINQWKVAFGTRDGYYGTSTTHPIPLLVNLRQDPFESYLQAPGPRAEISQRKTYMFNMVLETLLQHVGSLKAFPPTQKAASLDVNQIIQSLVAAGQKP